MRVAVFIEAFPKLSETFVIDHITSLIDRGLEVDVFARRDSNETPQPAVGRYNLRARTHYASGNSRFDRVCKLARALLLLLICRPRCLAALAGPAISVSKFDIIRISASVLASHRRYDIVHSHFGPNGILVARLRELGLLAEAKCVTTFHGYDVSSYVRQYSANVYAELFRSGDQFIAIGNEMKQRLIDMGCNAAKIAVIPMGVDVTRLQPTTNKSTSGRQILSVGRLVEKKGHTYAIAAVSLLVLLYPDLQYSIIGDGPLRDALEAQILEHGLARNVTLLGARSSDEVEAMLDKTDVFLTPSVTGADGDTEGNPVANMEAMAKALPVISSFHSSIPELVEDGVAGFLCKERDVQGIATTLDRLFGDSKLRRSLGRAGRLRVEQLHNRVELTTALIRLYSTLVR